MRKFPFIIAIMACLLAFLPSCEDTTDSYSALEAWAKSNNDWLVEQQKRTNADGTPYYKTVVPSWDPGAYVLVHYFNDRSLTQNNLKPLLTSSVDTRYKLSLYNGEPVDSSYNITTYGAGIFRTQLSNVIEGWTIALEDMHVGDTAVVVIPYQCAYGEGGNTNIPGYSNLMFNMSLVDIHTYEISPKSK